MYTTEHCLSARYTGDSRFNLPADKLESGFYSSRVGINGVAASEQRVTAVDHCSCPCNINMLVSARIV